MIKKVFKNKPRVSRVSNSTSGFSLVETLIAIFILALGITAFMSVASGGLRTSFFVRDRIQAFYLAQEAIEVIKNKRDENGIKNYENPDPGVHWLNDIASWAPSSGPCGPTAANDCRVDSIHDQVDSCERGKSCQLIKNNQNIFYHGPEDGRESKFSRWVNLTNVSSNEAKVKVTVTWNAHFGSGELVVEEHIFNWHPLSDEE